MALPKKALPDFSHCKNEEDSVSSGNNSNGWEREEGRVMHEFAAQAEADDARDDAAFPDIAMNETNEWEFLTEGNADKPPDEQTPLLNLRSCTFSTKRLQAKL